VEEVVLCLSLELVEQVEEEQEDNLELQEQMGSAAAAEEEYTMVLMECRGALVL
jgi:hypothetical protein